MFCLSGLDSFRDGREVIHTHTHTHTHTHIYIYIYTGWNDKIVALEKLTWFHFRLMKTGFLFFVADHLLVGQLGTNLRAIGAFYHVWNWHNVQQGRSKMRRCATHALYRSKLWQQDHCQHPRNANPDCSTCPGWWKKSFRLRLWSLMWFHVRATSCHLTSSKSAWKSTPKCTWMCWRVWWSPGAIRWPVADPGCGSRTRHRPTSPKRPRLGFRRSATTLYHSLTVLPIPPTWTRWTSSFWSYVVNITNMTSHNTKTSLIAAIRRVLSELLPALMEKACSQFRIHILAGIEPEGGYIE